MQGWATTDKMSRISFKKESEIRTIKKAIIDIGSIVYNLMVFKL